jgi:hypothetical protein
LPTVWLPQATAEQAKPILNRQRFYDDQEIDIGSRARSTAGESRTGQR